MGNTKKWKKLKLLSSLSCVGALVATASIAVTGCSNKDSGDEKTPTEALTLNVSDVPQTIEPTGVTSSYEVTATKPNGEVVDLVSGSVESSDPNVIEASWDSGTNQVTLKPKKNGFATLSITAQDAKGDNGSVKTSVSVTNTLALLVDLTNIPTSVPPTEKQPTTTIDSIEVTDVYGVKVDYKITNVATSDPAIMTVKATDDKQGIIFTPETQSGSVGIYVEVKDSVGNKGCASTVVEIQEHAPYQTLSIDTTDIPSEIEKSTEAQYFTIKTYKSTGQKVPYSHYADVHVSTSDQDIIRAYWDWDKNQIKVIIGDNAKRGDSANLWIEVTDIDNNYGGVSTTITIAKKQNIIIDVSKVPATIPPHSKDVYTPDISARLPNGSNIDLDGEGVEVTVTSTPLESEIDIIEATWIKKSEEVEKGHLEIKLVDETIVSGSERVTIKIKDSKNNEGQVSLTISVEDKVTLTVDAGTIPATISQDFTKDSYEIKAYYPDGEEVDLEDEDTEVTISNTDPNVIDAYYDETLHKVTLERKANKGTATLGIKVTDKYGNFGIAYVGVTIEVKGTLTLNTSAIPNTIKSGSSAATYPLTAKYHDGTTATVTSATLTTTPTDIIDASWDTTAGSEGVKLAIHTGVTSGSTKLVIDAVDKYGNHGGAIIPIAITHDTLKIGTQYIPTTIYPTTTTTDIEVPLKKGDTALTQNDIKSIEVAYSHGGIFTVSTHWTTQGDSKLLFDITPAAGIENGMDTMFITVTDKLGNVGTAFVTVRINNSNIIKGSYSTIKGYATNKQLIPGQQYQITDYKAAVASPTDKSYQSAGHQFDIILTATTNSTFDDYAKAINHTPAATEPEDYFADSNLNGWTIKYSLDNSYRLWGSAHGTGVLYYLEDEIGNEAPYDFKNIQYSHDSGATWYYTYSKEGETAGTYEDASLNDGTKVFDNVIKPYKDKDGFKLNDIIFVGDECYNNTFKTDCYDMTFGNKAHDNKFGTNCYNNTFKNNCNSNTFGDSFYNNTADAYFESNFFSNKCHDNAFGKYVRNNTFGDLFVSNEIDDSFRFNTFGSNCNNNKVGSSTGQETYVQYNTFNSGTQNMKILSGLVFQYNIVTNYIPYTYDPNDFPDGIINKIVRNGEIL